MRLAILFLLIGGVVFGQPTIPCAGTPGSTPGVHFQQCKATNGVTYVCSKTTCTAPADWVRGSMTDFATQVQNRTSDQLTYTTLGAGSVPVTVKQQLDRMPIDVMTKGAMGNGTTDDAAAIQRAIDSGRPVHLPTGTYHTTVKLNFPQTGTQNHTVFAGDGRYASIIEFSGTGPAIGCADPQAITDADMCRMSLSDFGITYVGSGTAQSISLDGVEHSDIHRVRIIGFTEGLVAVTSGVPQGDRRATYGITLDHVEFLSDPPGSMINAMHLGADEPGSLDCGHFDITSPLVHYAVTGLNIEGCSAVVMTDSDFEAITTGVKETHGSDNTYDVNYIDATACPTCKRYDVTGDIGVQIRGLNHAGGTGVSNVTEYLATWTDPHNGVVMSGPNDSCFYLRKAAGTPVCMMKVLANDAVTFGDMIGYSYFNGISYTFNGTGEVTTGGDLKIGSNGYLKNAKYLYGYLADGVTPKKLVGITAGDAVVLGDSTGYTYLDGVSVTSNKPLTITPIAVGSLPNCFAGTEGTRASVTNSNTATFGATIAAGGSYHVPAYCNGTNWVLM